MRIRRRYHFETPGVVYIGVTILIALGAFNSQNNLLFGAFGLALAVLIVSGLISGQMLMGLRLEREPLPTGTAGLPLSVRFRLHNRGRLTPAFALTIRQPVSGIPDDPWGFVAHVGPGGMGIAEVRFTPARRGLLTLGEPQVDTAFPFGIVRKSLTFAAPGRILVRPRPATVRGDLFARAAATRPRGSAPTRRSGHGDEFLALREYRAGDSPRAVAWRASARGDDLLVRQNHQAAAARWTIILNLGSGGEVDEAAISIATGLLVQAADGGLEVGLFVPGRGVLYRPGRAGRHYGAMLDDLARLDLAAPPSPASDRLPAAGSLIAVNGVPSRVGHPASAAAVQVDAADPAAWSALGATASRSRPARRPAPTEAGAHA